jgi:tetratricopeptide (TPR) repeat protein
VVYLRSSFITTQASVPQFKLSKISGQEGRFTPAQLTGSFKLSFKVQDQAECYLVYALAKAGQRDEAEKVLKHLETTKDYVSPAELAIAYAGLGQKEQALSSLERAYTAHDLQMQFIGVDPHYDSLRTEQGFKELIQKVGLPN